MEYKAQDSTFDPDIIKTDAPTELLYAILLQWKEQVYINKPVSSGTNDTLQPWLHSIKHDERLEKLLKFQSFNEDKGEEGTIKELQKIERSQIIKIIA